MLCTYIMPSGDENTNDLKKKQIREANIWDFQYIEELPENFLTQLQSANEEGYYIIEDDGLRKLKPEEAGLIDEETKIIHYDKEGNIYYGNCYVSTEEVTDEETNAVITNYHINKQGQGVMYDKYGHIVYKGLFSKNERDIGVNWNNKERKPILFKNKNNVLPKYHNENEAFISFAHNVGIGESGLNTSIEEHNIIAQKYAKSTLYDLTEVVNDNDYKQKVESTTQEDRNDYRNVKIFNFRLSVTIQNVVSFNASAFDAVSHET